MDDAVCPHGIAMATTTPFSDARPAGAWDVVVRLGDTDGSAVHPHLRRLLGPGPPQRCLSDAVHALCDVHGRHPGMIDDALLHGVQPGSLLWLEAAAIGFAVERRYLAELTAAVGPLPSTPGQAMAETALAGVRHALSILAESQRAGCASGAVAALLQDWPAIRLVLDIAALRFGVTVPAAALPALDGGVAAPGTDRAIGFGAQQLFAQHRGLWSLLEARAGARGDI